MLAAISRINQQMDNDLAALDDARLAYLQKYEQKREMIRALQQHDHRVHNQLSNNLVSTKECEHVMATKVAVSEHSYDPGPTKKE